MKITLKEVGFTDLVWCIARTKFTLFSMEREVIGKTAVFNWRLWENAEDRVFKIQDFCSWLLFQHIGGLSRVKHDGLLVYDVDDDKANRALTPCFYNIKVRSISLSLFRRLVVHLSMQSEWNIALCWCYMPPKCMTKLFLFSIYRYKCYFCKVCICWKW